MDRARLQQLAHAAIVPDLARGVRAAVATLVPFLLARSLGRHELAWMALGGWIGTLADPGGTRTVRARTLTTFAVLGSAIVVVGELAAPSRWLALALLTALAFAASIVRVLGANATSVGTLVAVTAAVATGGSATAPLRDAAAFAIGSGWAMVLSTVVWPVWTHLPVRVRVAAAWRELAAYATAVAEEKAPEGDPRWAAIAREHQPRVRAALEEARAVAIESRARHQGESVLGSSLRTVLSLAEHALGMLIAVASEAEASPTHERALLRFATTARLAADHLEQRVLSRELSPDADGGPQGRLDARLVETAVAGLRIARAPLEPQTAPALPAGTARRLADDLVLVRDALAWRSSTFAHALRVALAVAAAALVGARTSPTHAHWVTITTLAVLQPYPGATMTRAAERVVGTVLGGIVAIGITMTVHAPAAVAALMFPLSIAAVATKPRSYRLFTFFLTPVFVLLAEQTPGDWWVAVDRARDALVGGAIALAAAFLFPSRENERLDAAIADVRRTLGAYAHAVLERFASGASSEAMIHARRDLGIALGVAEASLERLLAEPKLVPGRSTATTADQMLFLTQARRLGSALTALDASELDASETERRAAGELLSWVTSAVDGTAATARPRFDGVAADVAAALRRIERTATLLRG